MADITKNIPKRSLAYGVGTAAILLTLALFGVLPQQREKEALLDRIAKAEADIKEQDMLLPTWASLNQKLSNPIPFREAIVEAPKEKSRVQIQDVSLVLSEQALSSAIFEAHFTPEPESISKDSGSVRVAGVLQGEFAAFRDFLLKVASAPYLHAFESAEIKRPLGLTEFNVRLRLNVGDAGSVAQNASSHPAKS